MFKKGLLIIFTIFLSLIGASNVDAASISISSSKNSVIVGNTITVTVTISGTGVIGQAYGTVNASSNLTLLAGSSGTSINYFNGTNEQIRNLTYTYKYKANATGNATITVTGVEVGNLETGAFETAATASKTITITKPASSGGSSGGGTTSNKKEYSSNNNLSSLEVEGYKIEPGFNKDTLEYKLTVDQSVEKVKINAAVEDKKASVAGTGEINLSPGENTHEVKVTAENGNEKKYKIIISVEDLNPIKVTIDNEEYTVVRKNNDLIEKMEHYEETTTKIGEDEIVAYTNETTNTTLVLLKNKDNVINYYIYDIKTNSYSKYNYLKISNVTLMLISPSKIPNKYNKYTKKIDDKEIELLKLNKKSKIGLIYGINITTGYEGFYQYDEKEQTISKYYEEELKLYKNETESYKKYLVITVAAFSFMTIIAVIVSLFKGKRRR